MINGVFALTAGMYFVLVPRLDVEWPLKLKPRDKPVRAVLFDDFQPNLLSLNPGLKLTAILHAAFAELFSSAAPPGFNLRERFRLISLR